VPIETAFYDNDLRRRLEVPTVTFFRHGHFCSVNRKNSRWQKAGRTVTLMSGSCLPGPLCSS